MPNFVPQKYYKLMKALPYNALNRRNGMYFDKRDSIAHKYALSYETS